MTSVRGGKGHSSASSYMSVEQLQNKGKGKGKQVTTEEITAYYAAKGKAAAKGKGQ